MDRIKVAGKVDLDYPASCGTSIITFLQLQFDRAYCMVNAPSRSEAIGGPMEITLPDRLHRHQHCPLHNLIPQTWDTERPQLAVRLCKLYLIVDGHPVHRSSLVSAVWLPTRNDCA